ncbi:6-phosphogluconolactonase/glucosamine-6-phosphate isomerase/deaminase [Encephalitozoon intestinalis ATCC 50506]|uniref:6-phosphogluconolactonase/glucosamine-6-phosphate isomerase/deaminase n=1 Tax=Encephalitozoon intestinalis (strain ATCC 50506) TaxID=876142 RepID=E0S6M3_ENCIT|nr:6-phosphogluconolactonase/glucosamine-6-phosphate isomerase/deaminase [Encephalitozoon intestinalis ATCC 50506]ADM11358.2 6-phosphogluconolactonase/glucosamine-6-phosphate isomerase/deaminase [Encephalitozoon intestinalis ATCC 50506]UTX45048.1 6-phosphogluconolactonase [Encephalitozoon intestinalis]
MDVLFTEDFSTEIYRILKEYSGRSLALMISGGSLLQCLEDKRYLTMDTSGWRIFYSDERADQNHLNYTGSIGFISKTNADVHRIWTSRPLDEAAKMYSAELPDIDVCLLGIGGDGHICSLPPGCKELESDDYVVALEGDFPISPRRVTVTPKFINEKIRDLYFVVPSSRKKGVSAPDRSITEKIERSFMVILEK